MKLVIRSLFLAATTVALTGCPAATQALLTAALPSGAPSTAPVAGASAAPATSTPAATAAPTTPAAKPTDAPVQAMDPSECKATKDDADKDNGTPAMGKYNNQWLPKTWADAYKSEAAVTAAIDKIKDADWACFQKFYPGATTVYNQLKGN